MIMNSYSLPISYCRQYLFCARIPYFLEVLGIKPSQPNWITQGNAYHKKQIILSKHRTLSRYGFDKEEIFFDIKVRSVAQNFHGIIDAIIITSEEIVPIEFKLSEKISRGHIMQVVGYAIAAEEFFEKKCQICFLLIGKKGKAHLIEITPDLRMEYYRLLEKINDSFKSSIMPHSSATIHQCSQCEFINFCNDRL